MMRREINLQQPLPCATSTPSKEEVFQSIRYNHVLKKQKLESNILILDDEVADAEIELFEVVQVYILSLSVMTSEVV